MVVKGGLSHLKSLATNFRQQKRPSDTRPLMCECLKQSTTSGLIIMQKTKTVKNAAPSKKLARMLKILSYVAKQNGRKVGTFEIQDFLKEKGIVSDIRTIQRDLNLLEDHFCGIKGDDCNPQGWFFAKDEESQLIAELLKEVA